MFFFSIRVTLVTSWALSRFDCLDLKIKLSPNPQLSLGYSVSNDLHGYDSCMHSILVLDQVYMVPLLLAGVVVTLLVCCSLITT